MVAGMLLAAALCVSAPARATDAAEVAYWQSIQASTDPAEYQSYIDTYPNGVFVKLARARIARLQAGGGGAATIPIPGLAGGGGTPAKPTAAPAPEPPAPPANETAETITVSPTVGRVGQMFTFTFLNLPDPSSYDKVIVVPAGTPDMDPTRSTDETKILAYDYARNVKQSGTWKAGPFAPGRYEVRFMTTLYDNDHKYEVHGRTAFSVR